MKKYILPIFIYAVTFIVTYLCQRYTLANQEALGLFLWTPDYLRETFNNPWPVSSLISSFLVQFFRINFFGEAVIAAFITLIFINLRIVLRRFGVKLDLICAILSGISWLFIARADTPRLGMTLVLLSAAAALISVILTKEKDVKEEGWNLYAIALMSVVMFAIIVGTDKKVKMNEIWGHIETASAAHNWDGVLKVATPEVTKEDRMMIPYALLALNGKGELSSRCDEYPVSGKEDLDTEGINSRRGYQFSSFLYECLNCPNEAMHQAFQAACFLPHGSSFRTLRQLVNYNYVIGDYTLVQKYCDILKHSSNNKAFVKQFEDAISGSMFRILSPENTSYTAPLITHNPQYNIYTLQNEGIQSDIALDRFKTYLMFDNNNQQ